MSRDPNDLARFLMAQEPVLGAVRAELRAGAKTTHWMWFIFPQLRGLGTSERAVFYGLAGRQEAERYAANPVLGLRLAEVTDLMLTHVGRPAEHILGSVDAIKLRSCATLFVEVANDPARFRAVLDGFYSGAPCDRTMALLEMQ